MNMGISRRITAYIGSMWEYRYFWYSLVKADLQRRYRRSFLGLGWSLLTPIMMTLVLSSVYSNILNMPFEKYGPFLMTGFAFWGFVSGAMLQGCSCFSSAEAYIRQEPAPIAIYPLRTVLSVGFHSLIAMALAIGLAACFDGVRSFPAMLSLIPTFLILIVMVWCLTTLLGLFSVYFPDVVYLAEVGLQMLFFLTPIIYPADVLQGRGFAEVLLYNPFAIMVDMIRTPILNSEVPLLATYLWMFSFVVFLIGATSLALAKMERKLVFEL